MTDDQHDWQFLDDIFYGLGHLDHPLYSVLASRKTGQARQKARKNLLTRALRSRKVPIQGCRKDSIKLSTAERIESKIDAKTKINISLNEITLVKVYAAEGPWPARKERIESAHFNRVQADMARVEQWLREKYVGADHRADEAKAAIDQDRNANDVASLDAPRKKPFPAARESELKAFFVGHAREQESKGSPNNENIARQAAEDHFGALITRERVRRLRKDAGCLGKQGAPQKRADKPAEK